MGKRKDENFEQIFAAMLIQCKKMESLYERKIDAHIDVYFKQYSTSIDFYDQFIDNMSN